MMRLGPLKLTLADVAHEAGISAATLVQRFGSKRGLLLAVSTAAAGSMDACFDPVRQTSTSPLAQLIDAAMFLTQAMAKPDDVANHLGFFLQVDLSDPDFYPLTLQMSRQIDAHYVRLANEAVAAGELEPCDTTALARAIGAVAAGSLIGWAVYRQGTAVTWVRRDIETLLAPYRRAASAAGSSRPRGRSSGRPAPGAVRRSRRRRRRG